MLRYLPFLLVLAVWIYAFIDVLNTPEKEIRHLPKVVWVIIVLLFGEVLLGPIAWFATGKVRHAPGGGGAARGRTRWVAPDDNPDFLKSLKDEEPDGDDDGKKPGKGDEG
ncbi:PLDc N-terminal domain-containing protein [Streptomyces sp. NPDC003032]